MGTRWNVSSGSPIIARTANLPIQSGGFTVIVDFKIVTYATNNDIFYLGITASASDFIMIECDSSGNIYTTNDATAGAFEQSNISAGTYTGRLQVAIAIDTTGYFVYYKKFGGAFTQGTTLTYQPFTPDLMQLGAKNTVAFGGSGGRHEIYNAKIWKGVRLEAAEIEMEMTQAAPIRQDLIHCWLPMLNPTGYHLDMSRNGNDWTRTGTALPLPMDPDARRRQLNFATSVSGSTAYTASLSETVSLSEAEASKFNAKVLALAETDSLSESLAPKFNAKATALAETLTLTEARATKLAAHASLTESASLTEGLAVLFRAIAGLSESDSLAEALAVSRHTAQALTESASLAESLTARLRALASLAESCSTTEAFAARWAALLGLAESASLAEAISARLAAQAALPEVLALAEALAARLGAQASLTEADTLSEALAASRGQHQALSEAVSLAEAAGIAYAAHAALTEALTFLEAFSGPGSVSVSESLALLEQLSVRVHQGQALAEAAALGEQLVALQAARAPLAEAVTAAERLTIDGGPGPSIIVPFDFAARRAGITTRATFEQASHTSMGAVPSNTRMDFDE